MGQERGLKINVNHFFLSSKALALQHTVTHLQIRKTPYMLPETDKQVYRKIPYTLLLL